MYFCHFFDSFLFGDLFVEVKLLCNTAHFNYCLKWNMEQLLLKNGIWNMRGNSAKHGTEYGTAEYGTRTKNMEQA
jgi:hypothetical protein